MNKTYTVEDVCRVLNNVSGISITATTISIKKGTEVGIKLQGKLDYLQKNGYSINYVDNVKDNKRTKSVIDEDEAPKRRKKKNGIDIVSSVKKSIKFKLK